MIVKLPVSAHVQKFLEKEIGPSFNYSQKEKIPEEIADSLSDITETKKSTIKNNDITYTYSVEIPEDMLPYWKGDDTTNPKKDIIYHYEFNDKIDKLFRDKIVNDCKARMHTEKIIDVVREWFEYYDISPFEMTEETILKYLYRNGVVKKHRYISYDMFETYAVLNQNKK